MSKSKVVTRNIENAKAGSIIFARTSDAIVPAPDWEKIEKAKAKRDGLVSFLTEGWADLPVVTAGAAKSRAKGTKVALVPVNDYSKSYSKKAERAGMVLADYVHAPMADGRPNGVSIAENLRLWVVQHFGEHMRDAFYIGFVPAEG